MKYVYGVVGIIAGIAAVVVGILGMPDVMIVSGLLAAVLILTANADRILRVKATATGFEAETRAVIDKALATIDQLRAVAKIAVQANLRMVMRSGRWDGFSVDEKEMIRKGSLEALDGLHIPKTEQEEMFREWHTVNRFDYAHLLLGRSTIPREIQDNLDLQGEWSRLRGGGFKGNPSADVVAEFLRRAGMLDAERAELLEDYRYYEKHGEHRRFHVWRRLWDREG